MYSGLSAHYLVRENLAADFLVLVSVTGKNNTTHTQPTTVLAITLQTGKKTPSYNISQTSQTTE